MRFQSVGLGLGLFFILTNLSFGSHCSALFVRQAENLLSTKQVETLFRGAKKPAQHISLALAALDTYRSQFNSRQLADLWEQLLRAAESATRSTKIRMNRHENEDGTRFLFEGWRDYLLLIRQDTGQTPDQSPKLYWGRGRIPDLDSFTWNPRDYGLTERIQAQVSSTDTRFHKIETDPTSPYQHFTASRLDMEASPGAYTCDLIGAAYRTILTERDRNHVNSFGLADRWEDLMKWVSTRESDFRYDRYTDWRGATLFVGSGVFVLIDRDARIYRGLMGISTRDLEQIHWDSSSLFSMDGYQGFELVPRH